MDSLKHKANSNVEIEVRFFGDLRKLALEKGLGFPCFLTLSKECSAIELAELLKMPIEKIEAVFVNGSAIPIKEARVSPGDRIGFIPIGIPGPYRVLLGFKKIEKTEG
jgi:hypothetical protein